MRQMIITFLFCVFCTGIVFVLSAHDAYALRVSLKRVVFEGPKRSEILTIINNTGEEQTYRLGWRKYKMDEYKSLKAVDENGDDSGVLWADDMVRFAPRRVTIPAGGSQQIRLLLRRPSDLQTAEYRSHLWIVTETKPEKFDIQTDSKDGQAIKLAVQPAISLPVFVRNGALQASASISDAKLTRTGGGLKASFVLNREGNESIYGDFDFICTDSGQNKVLKQVRGISVYPEISKRYLDFDIGLGPETATSCNSVNILYRADPDDPEFKGKTLAQSTVTLSN